MNNGNESQFAGTEYEDAPFAGGDSEQGAVEDEGNDYVDTPTTRDNLPFANAIPDCGPNGPYVDVAFSEGDHQLVINGEVSEFTVLPQQVSDYPIGLTGQSIALDSEVGEITITSTAHGKEVTTGGAYELDCVAETVEVASEPAEDLPTAGLSTDMIGPLALVLGAVGVALVRFARSMST